MRKRVDATFDIVKTLFAVLEHDRPEISLSGLHVLFLTECFYHQLPSHYQKKLNLLQLKYGALLHDIGKIAIPKEILNKAGKLEKAEMELVKSHTDTGADILKNLPGLKEVSGWIKYHHERVDGKGYYHLKGAEIPLEAKIIALTDAYSSIIMASSFKPSRTHEDAISILKMEEGKQFHPELTEIFCCIPPNRLNEATEKAINLMRQAESVFQKSKR